MGRVRSLPREPAAFISRVSSASLADAGLALAVGALVVYLSFQAGGFFPGATAVAATTFLTLLAVVIATQADLVAGLTLRLAVVGGAFVLLCAWILLSSLWSDSPARALLEFDRALLYLAVILVCALPRYSLRRLQWMLRAVVAALLAVCCCALITRLAPDVWPTASGLADERLSYPLTYWNTLGIMAALGAVLCLHLASSEREPRALRVAGAAAVPTMAAVVVLTFSRGAIAAAAAAIVAYLAVGRPRLAICGLVAIVPATVVSSLVSLNAELVGSVDFRTPAAVREGHDTALVIALCAGAAAVLRAALLPLDGRLVKLRSWSIKRTTALGSALLLLLGCAVAASHFELGERLDRQVDRFVNEPPPSEGRQRLTNPANPARVKQWDIALEAFRDKRLAGHGAGTYQLLWERRRTANFEVTDAHSLYLEALSEIGLVGAALLILALFGLMGVVAARCRGPNRAVFAAVLAVGLAWMLHAGIDWDWEEPAATIWVFALAASAIASRGRKATRGRQPSRWIRVAACAVVALVALVPLQIAMSQAHLDDSVRASKEGDCRRAVASARIAISSLDVRPEPFSTLGYCASRLGEHRLAVSSLESAAARDPHNWRPRYGLALVRAAAGRDPRQALAQARRRNPLGMMARDLADRLRGARRPDWPRIARRSRLPPP